MNERSAGFSTRAVHATGYRPVGQVPTSIPIYQTSTWRHGSSDAFAEALAEGSEGYAYGRGYGNPTVEAFESVMASLEGTEAAFAFSSGMSAIHTVCVALGTARPADGRDGGRTPRIVASTELYGGTYSLFAKILPSYGIEVELVDPHDIGAVTSALPGAAMFYCETIANPLCTVADLPALAAACRRAGVPSVVDSTFASPYLCNPAELGFDFVVHSATKMIAGHSDVLAGVICCSADDRALLRAVAIDTGGAMQPFDAWLCIRGVETLELRMERHGKSGLELAELLQSSSKVSAVHYPGLPTHPHHDLAKRMFKSPSFGGMLSFELDGGLDVAARWCDELQLGWIGASLGGTHTLVCHPASTTHRQVPPEARRAAGLGDGLIRVSTGIENTADLLEDFSEALTSL
ncbi:MAG: trans-sulfuration enzyme family protein [Acidimicrobiales bacterium]